MKKWRFQFSRSSIIITVIFVVAYLGLDLLAIYFDPRVVLNNFPWVFYPITILWIILILLFIHFNFKQINKLTVSLLSKRMRMISISFIPIIGTMAIVKNFTDSILVYPEYFERYQDYYNNQYLTLQKQIILYIGIAYAVFIGFSLISHFLKKKKTYPKREKSK